MVKKLKIKSFKIGNKKITDITRYTDPKGHAKKYSYQFTINGKRGAVTANRLSDAKKYIKTVYKL